MIGAGVFAVFAPAARAAGTWLLPASRSPPSSPRATRRRAPSSRRRTPAPAAPTSTAARCSATGGASWPAGLRGRQDGQLRRDGDDVRGVPVPDGWQSPSPPPWSSSWRWSTARASPGRPAHPGHRRARAGRAGRSPSPPARGGSASAPGRLGLRRPVGAAAVGGAAVLRVRRVRPIATLGEEVRDPARIIPRASWWRWPGPWSCTPWSRWPCWPCSDRAAGASTAPLADVVAAAGCDWAARSSGSVRGCRRRCAAQPGGRPGRPAWRSPARATCRTDCPRCTRRDPCRSAPSSPSRRSWWPSAARGPARGDRLLVVRRPALLPDRERRGAGSGRTTNAGTRAGSRCSDASAVFVLVATLPWQSVVAGLSVFAVGDRGRLVRLRR